MHQPYFVDLSVERATGGDELGGTYRLNCARATVFFSER
jgi:hypothetical protein